eukprot:scaffold16116_cov111-Isochrysis_galbana.AAC.4
MQPTFVVVAPQKPRVLLEPFDRRLDITIRVEQAPPHPHFLKPSIGSVTARGFEIRRNQLAAR